MTQINCVNPTRSSSPVFPIPSSPCHPSNPLATGINSSPVASILLFLFSSSNPSNLSTLSWYRSTLGYLGPSYLTHRLHHSSTSSPAALQSQGKFPYTICHSLPFHHCPSTQLRPSATRHRKPAFAAVPCSSRHPLPSSSHSSPSKTNIQKHYEVNIAVNPPRKPS